MIPVDCSYWITVSGAAEEAHKAAAMLESLHEIKNWFQKDIDEDGDIHYEVTEGTISQWDGFDQEMEKVAVAHPTVNIRTEEIDEDTHTFLRLYLFANGKLESFKCGRMIDPEEYDSETIRYCMNVLKEAGFADAAQYLNDKIYTDGD